MSLKFISGELDYPSKWNVCMPDPSLSFTHLIFKLFKHLPHCILNLFPLHTFHYLASDPKLPSASSEIHWSIFYVVKIFSPCSLHPLVLTMKWCSWRPTTWRLFEEVITLTGPPGCSPYQTHVTSHHFLAFLVPGSWSFSPSLLLSFGNCKVLPMPWPLRSLTSSPPGILYLSYPLPWSDPRPCHYQYLQHCKIFF